MNSVQRAILVELRERHVDFAKLNSELTVSNNKDESHESMNLNDVLTQVLYDSADSKYVRLETQPMDDMDIEDSLLSNILSYDSSYFRIKFAKDHWGGTDIIDGRKVVFRIASFFVSD